MKKRRLLSETEVGWVECPKCGDQFVVICREWAGRKRRGHRLRRRVIGEDETEARNER